MTEPQSVALIPCACEFDAWFDSPYTKVLMKSVAEDYVPRIAALSAQVREMEAQAAYMRERLEIHSLDAERYRTWLAYAFSEEEGTETFLIDTPEKMQEWLDKRTARGEK